MWAVSVGAKGSATLVSIEKPVSMTWAMGPPSGATLGYVQAQTLV